MEAVLPPHAERELRDPFADSHAGRNALLAALLAGAALACLWLAGLLDCALPSCLKKNPPDTPLCAELPEPPAKK